jgi:cysteine desulfuration protein SufE
MLFEALNGQPPETTLAIPPDFVRQVMGKIGLQARENGLNAMVERLRRAALRAREEAAAPPSSAA